VPQEETVPLSKEERALVQKIAERDGITFDEAASRLVSDGLARRVRSRTGKTPAKVYPMRKPR